MISYLLEVTIYQFVLLALYYVGFKRYTFFQVNRFYLLFSIVISFIIPFISMPGAIQKTPIMLPEIILNSGVVSPVNIIEKTSNNLNLDIVFFIGLVLFTALFVIRIIKLYRIITLNPTHKKNEFTLVTLQNENEVFSWFKYVFAHDDKLNNETLSHELVHIKQKHSLDILFIELVHIILWFSPVVRWYKQELQLVHEYQADAKAIKESVSSYAHFLVNELFQVNELSLVHNFWKVSQIKNRIKMLKTMKTKRIKSLRYLLILPVLAMFTLEYSCTRDKENSSEINEIKNSDEQIFNFQVVDVQPQIIGVDENLSKQDKYMIFQKAIMKHVKDNFKYPEQAKRDSISGRVVVQFVFGKDGKVRDTKVLRGVNEELDTEAIRIVNLFPDVTPAKQNGKPVAVSFMLPITFRLQ